MGEKDNPFNFHEEVDAWTEMRAFDALRVIRQAELDIASLSLETSPLEQQTGHALCLIASMGALAPFSKIAPALPYKKISTIVLARSSADSYPYFPVEPLRSIDIESGRIVIQVGNEISKKCPVAFEIVHQFCVPNRRDGSGDKEYRTTELLLMKKNRYIVRHYKD